MNEWTKYEGLLIFSNPDIVNYRPTIRQSTKQLITETTMNAPMENQNLKSILAGCPDETLPTNEEIMSEDMLAVIQNEVRKQGFSCIRGLDEKLLKGTILWYIQSCTEGKG